MAAARARLHSSRTGAEAEGTRGPQPKFVRVYADRTTRADPPSQVEIVADALFEMAAPDLAALGPRARKVDLDLILDAAVFAYNQPIHEASGMATGPGTGAMLRSALESMFQNAPGFRARYERMLKVRTERFGHLETIIMIYRAGFADRGGVYFELVLPPEKGPESGAEA